MTPPPSDAAEILKLIENVDPSNSKMMDEIDERVAFYLAAPNGYKLARVEVFSWVWKSRHGDGHKTHQGRYTRSRDALKAIRPTVKDGWWNWSIDVYPSWACVEITRSENYGSQKSQRFPTEELAELYMIIKAIEFERTGIRL